VESDNPKAGATEWQLMEYRSTGLSKKYYTGFQLNKLEKRDGMIADPRFHGKATLKTTQHN